MNHQLPAWAEQLKGQTIVEDTMSGKGERAAMVEQQHQRIMEHMSHDPQVQGVNTGMYNTSAMMHQYGAGGQDMTKRSTNSNAELTTEKTPISKPSPQKWFLI